MTAMKTLKSFQTETKIFRVVRKGSAMMLVMAVKTSWLLIALTAAAATLPSCYEVTDLYFEMF